jgi:hypothetical protein
MFFGCDKEVSRTPVEPEAPEGFIYIDSDPQGFEIFLDERKTGRVTPDSISYIDKGQYEITLKQKYFKDTSIVLNLGENEKQSLYIDILSNLSMYGNLTLVSSPEGATISINDSLINEVTPVTLQNLLPGSYTVKLGLYNHRDKELLVAVESSKTKTYTESLRDTSVWVDYQVFNSGIQSNSLTAITVDQNNVKWFGTLENGLISYDELNFVNINKSNSQIPDDRINCVSIDLQNRVWVGTDFGIGIFDGFSWTVYNRNNSELTSEIINTIEFDEYGNAWIGTTANLIKIEGINWTVYNEPSGWGDWINAIYIESQNSLLLGTTLNGVYQFLNKTFVSLPQPLYGYPSKTISSNDADQFGNIWFCFLPDTAGRGGISYWDGSSFTNYVIGTPQINVRDVFIDNQNKKWFATSEGFILIDAQNISTTFRTDNSYISSNLTNACVQDLNGNVWITTFASGLNKYKPPR